MHVLRMTRRWLPAVVLVALVAAPASAADVDAYLPADTQVVMTINVRQILDSPLVKKHALEAMKAFFKTNDRAREVLEPLGFDPLTDVHSLIVAGPGGTDKEKGLVIVHGKFDVDKLKAKADEVSKKDEKKLKPVKEGDYTLYQTEFDQGGNKQPIYLAIVDETTVVGGPGKEYVAAVLDRKAGKSKGEVSAEMKTLLGKSDTSQSMSFAALGDVLKKAQLGGAAEKIDSLVGGFTVANDFKLDVNIASKDADTAKSLSKDLKERFDQLKGLASMITAEKPGLTPLVDSLKGVKIEADGSNVSIKGEISNEVIEQAISGAKEGKGKEDKDK